MYKLLLAMFVTAKLYYMYVAVAYTLIPAGVLAGIGEATMWPVMTLFVVHYAKRFSLYAKKPTESYMTQFIGIFYCLFHLSGVRFRVCFSSIKKFTVHTLE